MRKLYPGNRKNKSIYNRGFSNTGVRYIKIGGKPSDSNKSDLVLVIHNIDIDEEEEEEEE